MNVDGNHPFSQTGSAARVVSIFLLDIQDLMRGGGWAQKDRLSNRAALPCTLYSSGFSDSSFGNHVLTYSSLLPPAIFSKKIAQWLFWLPSHEQWRGATNIYRFGGVSGHIIDNFCRDEKQRYAETFVGH